ncbi:peptidylprolyl isomerase [Chryseobacterium foetidum]|uniref:peptidylprolyl isomerase n=1 Tax=Chryseobacterium foetidum TaxID=2951057 RepID=UPI0021C5AEEC|nr:peptidylprolyl isomerase [Chryseobacterium foetidum]
MKKLIVFSALILSQLFFSQTTGGIRVVESKKTDLKSELSKDKIKLYDSNFQSFVLAMKNSDKTKISSLLSEKVKEIVTDDHIKKLSGGISFDRKMEVYKSGYQTIINNETYPAIQYKFVDDKSVPPADLVTAIFEEDGKILGIKPEFRQ